MQNQSLPASQCQAEPWQPLEKCPPGLLLGMTHYVVWNIPKVSLGQLSHFCSLPTYCPPTACLLGGEGVREGKGETLDAV